MNLQRAFLSGVVLVVAFLGARAATAQSTAFMCAAGITGSSTDAQFPGCSQILAVSYAVGIEGGVPPPLGSGAPVTTSCGLHSVTKEFDTSSIPIMIQSLLGQTIPEVKFSVRQDVPSPLVIYELILRNVLVVQVSQTLATIPGLPAEIILLQPAQVSWQFTPQDATGAALTPVTGGFDCVTKTAL